MNQEMPLLLVTQLLGLLHNGFTKSEQLLMTGVEAGGTTNIPALNDEDIWQIIITKDAGAQNSISEYYGQSAIITGNWIGYQPRGPDGNLTGVM